MVEGELHEDSQRYKLLAASTSNVMYNLVTTMNTTVCYI